MMHQHEVVSASDLKVKNTFIHFKIEADVNEDNVLEDCVTPWIRHHSEPSPKLSCTASTIPSLAGEESQEESEEQSELAELDDPVGTVGLCRQETEQLWPTWQPTQTEPISGPQCHPAYYDPSAAMMCGYGLPPNVVAPQAPEAMSWAEENEQSQLVNKNSRRKGRSLIDRAWRENETKETDVADTLVEVTKNHCQGVDATSWADTPIEVAAACCPVGTPKAASKEEEASKTKRFCHNCGGQTQQSYKFCRYCGTQVLKLQ